MKIGIFCDLENLKLNYADFIDVYTLMSKRGNIECCTLYGLRTTKHSDFMPFLSQYGYEAVAPIIVKGNRNKTDMRIVIDVARKIEEAPSIDTYVLAMSGYILPLVSHLKAQGKNVLCVLNDDSDKLSKLVEVVILAKNKKPFLIPVKVVPKDAAVAFPIHAPEPFAQIRPTNLAKPLPQENSSISTQTHVTSTVSQPQATKQAPPLPQTANIAQPVAQENKSIPTQIQETSTILSQPQVTKHFSPLPQDTSVVSNKSQTTTIVPPLPQAAKNKSVDHALLYELTELLDEAEDDNTKDVLDNLINGYKKK